MSQNIERFAVADPRTFDGSPYEVASRAVSQLRALLILAQRSIPATKLMVRNAELERQMALDQEPNALAWENGAQAVKLNQVEAALIQAEASLRILEKAAGFDPKHPDRA